jgi:hypothetical protein
VVLPQLETLHEARQQSLETSDLPGADQQLDRPLGEGHCVPCRVVSTRRCHLEARMRGLQVKVSSLHQSPALCRAIGQLSQDGVRLRVLARLLQAMHAT